MFENEQIPEQWQCLSIGELASPMPNAIVDGPFGSNLRVSDYTESGVPVLQGGNITGNQFQLNDLRFVSHRKAHELGRSWVTIGDLLVVKIGSIGYAAIIDSLDPHTHAIIPANLLKATFDRGKVSPRYVLHYLTSPAGVRTLSDAASRTAQHALKLSNFKALRILVPPLQEQDGITKILDTLDAAIQETETLIAKLRQVKVGLLHQLLTRGPDEHGQLRDPVAHPEQFKDSVVGMIPKEWKLRRLDTLCHLLNGLAFKPEDWTTHGTPIIRIQNLNGSPEFNYLAGTISAAYLIQPGTLLFAWSGNRGTSFGPFIWKGPTGVLNQHIFKVSLRAGVRQKWFFYALDRVRQQAEREAHGGSGLVHIRREDLLEYIIPTPDEAEQERIEIAISTVDNRISAEESYREKLRLLKHGLMSDLLSGRVRISTIGGSTE